MKIIEKFIQKQANLRACRQPAIAFLGDSVTQGCFEIYTVKGSLKVVFSPDDAYSEKLRRIFAILYPNVSLNVINAGISGDSTWMGVKRLDEDVLSFNPDLVVVCYGLNDATKAADGIDEYEENLRQIFTRIQATGAEVIFMTPSLRSNDPDYRNPDPLLERIVRGCSENERAGWLQKYLERARKAAAECNVPVCDCNAIWLKMAEAGVNTNALLSNDVNHPTRELHWMFAYELVKTILGA